MQMIMNENMYLVDVSHQKHVTTLGLAIRALFMKVTFHNQALKSCFM